MARTNTDSVFVQMTTVTASESQIGRKIVPNYYSSDCEVSAAVNGSKETSSGRSKITVTCYCLSIIQLSNNDDRLSTSSLARHIPSQSVLASITPRSRYVACVNCIDRVSHGWHKCQGNPLSFRY